MLFHISYISYKYPPTRGKPAQILSTQPSLHKCNPKSDKLDMKLPNQHCKNVKLDYVNPV